MTMKTTDQSQGWKMQDQVIYQSSYVG